MQSTFEPVAQQCRKRLPRSNAIQQVLSQPGPFGREVHGKLTGIPLAVLRKITAAEYGSSSGVIERRGVDISAIAGSSIYRLAFFTWNNRPNNLLRWFCGMQIFHPAEPA